MLAVMHDLWRLGMVVKNHGSLVAAMAFLGNMKDEQRANPDCQTRRAALRLGGCLVDALVLGDYDRPEITAAAADLEKVTPHGEWCCPGQGERF